MIDIQISGNLPQVNDNLEPAMSEIADIMFLSVQQNFIAGGRPNQWEPLKPFGESSHLYRSGRLFESLQLQWDGNSATVFIDTSRLPYASILNYGGTIKHPGSNKFQAFEYMGGMVYTYGTKPHDINIPQRMFMLFQEEDKTKILQILSNAIFIQGGETIQ